MYVVYIITSSRAFLRRWQLAPYYYITLLSSSLMLHCEWQLLWGITRMDVYITVWALTYYRMFAVAGAEHADCPTIYIIIICSLV